MYPSHSQLKSSNSASQYKQYSILPDSITSDLKLERSRYEELRILDSNLIHLEHENEELYTLLQNTQKALDEYQYKNQIFTEKLTNLIRLERNTSEEINEVSLSLKSAENQVKSLKNELKTKQNQDFAFLSAENIGLRKKLNDLRREASDQRLVEVAKKLEKDKLLEQKSFLQEELESERKKSFQLSQELKTAEICQSTQDIREENQSIKSHIRGTELKLQELQSKYSNLSSSSLQSSKTPSKSRKSSKSRNSSNLISNPSAFSTKSLKTHSPRPILKQSRKKKNSKKVEEDEINDKEISLTISKIQSDLSDLSKLIQKSKNQDFIPNQLHS
jgi:hypothetical protein